jgi:sulfur-carrier protein adenylyltransferase/sulfurtransferase
MPLLSTARPPLHAGVAWRERYSPHLMLPEIGTEGQLALLNAKILLVGLGGLASSCALALASAGIGRLGIVDGDQGSGADLSRRAINAVGPLGELKMDSAGVSITALPRDTQIIRHNTRLDASNVSDTVSGYDVVVDGVDNFPARYLLADASMLLGIPVVSAAVFEFEGHLSILSPPAGPCYRCLYPAPPPPALSHRYPVFSILPTVMGVLQAIEVVKLLLGAGRSLTGCLLVYDALRAEITELKVAADPACPACSGLHPRAR